MVGGERDRVTGSQKHDLPHKSCRSGYGHQVDAIEAEVRTRLFNEMLSISFVDDFIGFPWDIECVGESDIVFEWSEVGDKFPRADAFDNFEGNIAVMVIDESHALPSFQLERIGLCQLDRVNLGGKTFIADLVRATRLGCSHNYVLNLL